MEQNFNGSEQADGEPSNGSAESGPPPFHFRFSTADIPPEGRFETWRDVWMRQLVELDISCEAPQRFSSSVEVWPAGPISVVRFDVSRAVYERTAAHANNGDNDFSLTLFEDACGYVTSPETDPIRLRRGGSFLLAHDRRFTVLPATDHYEVCFLRVDRKALLDLMPRNSGIGLRGFSARCRTMKMIRNMVPLLTTTTEPTTQQRRMEIGQQLVDLVALALSPSREGRDLVERRGLRAAHIGAVLQAIDRHFANPRLSADFVAREVGISGRHVHRLLEQTTKTFYEHVLERRLAHAHGVLSDASSKKTKVADVAWDSGFTSTGYFHEAFRRRFGDTPAGVRTAVTV